MLDDFCEEAGYCRRHTARVLHQAGQWYLLGESVLVGGATKRLHRHWPPLYGPAVQKALIPVWNASTFLGPVRLTGGMPLFVENQNSASHGHLHLEDETRRLLLQMSPGTAGRLLMGGGGRIVCADSVIPGVPLWVARFPFRRARTLRWTSPASLP